MSSTLSASSALATSTSSTGKDGEGKDPGPVLGQEEGDEEADKETEMGSGFVPPHLRVVEEPSLGWASYVR